MALVILALGAGACAGPRTAAGESGDANGPDGSGSASPTQEASVMIREGVRLTLSTGPAAAAGQPITFELAVSNEGDGAEVIDFPNGQRYDFEVFAADGTSVWHWADGMFFTMMLGRETIAPGGELRWSERLESGLEAGTYRVVGTLAAMERASAELSLVVAE